MCLVTKHKMLVAQNDILVYKIIHINDQSLYQGFFYMANDTYNLAVGEFIARIGVEPGSSTVHEGFHSYASKKMAIELANILSDIPLAPVKVVEFTIPKGTAYFFGEDELGRLCYASESIRSGSLVEGEI